MNKRKIIIIITPLIIILAGVGIKNYFASFKEDPSKKPILEPIMYVNAQKISYKDVESNINAYGRIMSNSMVTLVAEVGGRLESGNVSLKNATAFNKGDIIYKIDQSEASLSLKAQKSDFLSLLSSIIPDLKIDYPESAKEWEDFVDNFNIDNKIPELPEIKNSKEKLFLSSRNVYNAYYQIKSAEKRLERYQYLAPFNGVITTVNAEVGSILNPGNAIATIIATENLEAELLIKKEDVAYLNVGDTLHLTSNDGINHLKAKISRIGSHMDPNSRTINVYVSFSNTNNNKNFIDGAFVEAIIPAKNILQSMKIPRQSLVGSKTVFVVKDGKLALKEINVMRVETDFVVFNGLDEGEIVVIESLANATENMPVEAVIQTTK